MTSGEITGKNEKPELQSKSIEKEATGENEKLKVQSK